MLVAPLAKDNSCGNTTSIIEPSGTTFVGNISRVYFVGSYPA
jgi:hypothetical protein